MWRATVILLSAALALTYEAEAVFWSDNNHTVTLDSGLKVHELNAFNALRNPNMMMRLALGEKLKRHEAAVADPTTSLRRRVEAWEYLSGHTAALLLKGSSVSGGTATRDQDESFFLSDDVAEASVAAVGDANLPLKTRIEALRVTAVMAQFYSASGRLNVLDPDGNVMGLGRDLHDNIALGADGDGVGPLGASVLVRLATPKALQSYASIVAAAGEADGAHDFSALARIYADLGYKDHVAEANFDYERQMSLMYSDRPRDAPWEARFLVIRTLSSLTLDYSVNKRAVCYSAESDAGLLELAVRAIDDAPALEFRGQAARLIANVAHRSMEDDVEATAPCIKRIADAGTLPALLQLAKDADVSMYREDALMALNNLVTDIKEMETALFQVPGALKTLIAFLESPSTSRLSKFYSVALLREISSTDVRGVVAAGALRCFVDLLDELPYDADAEATSGSKQWTPDAQLDFETEIFKGLSFFAGRLRSGPSGITALFERAAPRAVAFLDTVAKGKDYSAAYRTKIIVSCISALQFNSRRCTGALVRAGAVPIVQRVLDRDVLDDNEVITMFEYVLRKLKMYKGASQPRSNASAWKLSPVKLVIGLLACFLGGGYCALAKPKPVPKKTWTERKKATPRNKKAPAGKRGKKAPRPRPAPKAVSREAEPESSSESEPEPAPKPAPTLRRRAKPRAPPVVVPVSRASESKQEEPVAAEPAASAPRGYEVVACVLEAAGAPQLLALFTENQIDDSALPTIEPRDLIELGVAPMLVLTILGPASAANKSKKLEAEDMLHDVATHQSVLEAELAEHRAEIEKLRIGRGELPDDYYCSITCEVMSDPVMAADGYSYERVAIEQWLATGAGTSPKTNELLENEKLLPNKALKALIVDELERRARGRV